MTNINDARPRFDLSQRISGALDGSWLSAERIIDERPVS